MQIRSNRTDIAVSIAKRIVGALPVVGALAAEVIGTFIPNQRIDRIENLLLRLDQKLASVGTEDWKNKFQSPEFIDLLEDGMVQGSRALSDERRDYLASLLKNSLTQSDLDHFQQKRLLGLLSELNDIEVLLLQLFSLSGMLRQSFMNKHAEVLTPPRVVPSSPPEEIDRGAVYDSYKNHLVQLGLIRPKRKAELPEFGEEPGMVRSHRYEATDLGRLLLRYIG